MVSADEPACAVACRRGRHLLPTCKRRVNSEGLGSTIGFWRAGAAYAALLNLTLTNEPILAGHGISAATHDWLSLGDSLPCSGRDLRAAVEAGPLQAVAFTDRTRLDDLQLAAEGRARAGSAAAAVLATPGDALFVLDGCPKLSGGTRLGGGVAERVESQLREGR